MDNFKQYIFSLQEKISRKEISDLEKFVDKILKHFSIDVEFSSHFIDRVNDTRNDPEITISELQNLFKKIQKERGEKLKDAEGTQVVLKDLQNNLNIPVIVDYKNGEFVVIGKTIMRKKNFKTPNKIIKYK
jgi:hypothetical protein